MLEAFNVLVESILPGQLVGAREVVDPLVGQHGFESVGFGVDPGPHQVVVRVGGVNLVEPVGVANLADEFGIRVHCLEGQVVLLTHPLWLGLGQSLQTQHNSAS